VLVENILVIGDALACFSTYFDKRTVKLEDPKNRTGSRGASRNQF